MTTPITHAALELQRRIEELTKERDEAREGLDRLEAAYSILSDDVFRRQVQQG